LFLVCLAKFAKHFESGLFIGEITAVNTKRGRSLYTVLYEDGDGEDLNDREYKEARDLFDKTQGVSMNTAESERETAETEDEPFHSGGETEGSEFAPSDDEQEKNRKKKKRNQKRSPEKEKAKRKRGNNVKEEELILTKSTKSTGSKRKKNVIDVDAILQSGSKDNITNKTVALMDEKQAEALTETAGRSILKQAKKGLRVEAFKVVFLINVSHFEIFRSCPTIKLFLSLSRPNIQTWSVKPRKQDCRVCVWTSKIWSMLS
jgi:hypothetical protein